MSIQEPETGHGTAQVAEVVGAAPPPRPRLPLMTFGLVGANLLMAFVQWAAAGFPTPNPQYSNQFAEWVLGAKVPSLVAHGEYWRLVTANFLHGDVFHLLFNLVGLLVLGRLVELFYGRLRLLVIYTLACVAGAVVSYKVTQGISLGASTGVFGLLAATLLHNWKYRRYLPDRVNAIYPALVLILVLEFVIDNSRQGVDIAGHVGGALGGFLVAAMLESRIAGPHQNERDWLPLPTAVATAVLLLAYGAYGVLGNLPTQMSLLRAGRSEDPRFRREQLELLVQERPYFVEAKLTLAAVRMRNGDLEGGKQIYFDVLRANPSMRSSQIGQRIRDIIGRAYAERATRAYMAGNWEEALAAHREVFNIEPVDKEVLSEAHNGYAWTLVDKLNRDYKEAEKHAEIAIRLQPDAAAIVDTLAWAYFKQGRYQEALATQLRAVEMLKKTPTREPAEYYYHLGAIYERLGDKARSAANYSQALTLQSWRFPQAEEGLRRVAPNALPPPSQRRIPVFPRRRDPSEDRGLI